MKKNSNESFSSTSITFRSNDKFLSDTANRHPSIYDVIPTNCVNNVLQNIHSNYGTPSRPNLRSVSSIEHKSQQQNYFSPSATAPANLFPTASSNISYDLSSHFDPLAPSKEKILHSNISSVTPSSETTNGSNLIDF